MKKMIIVSFLTLSFFTSTMTIGQQCCPYIGPIVVLPPNPTCFDDIKVILTVGTPDQGFKLALGYSWDYNQSTINFIGCYYDGVLTSPDYYVDTVHIGQLPTGNYLINFIAHMSYLLDSCYHDSTNFATQQFSVTAQNNINEFVTTTDFSIYPNPTTDKITVDCVEQRDSKVTVYTLIGDCVLQGQLHGGKNEIDIGSLSKGIYLIRLTGDNWTGQRKIIKE